MQGGGAVEVDVVVLTWNDGELLDLALRSVLESTGVRPNLVVVDNGSDERASASVAPEATVMRLPRNLGVALGRTLGVSVGRAPFVCLLDSDARLLPDTLLRLVRRLVADPSVALVAPLFVDQPPEASGGAAPTLRTKALRAMNRTGAYAPGRRAGDVIEVDFAIGACQVFRRSAWDAVGGLDPGIFYGPEDVDFCLRLREAGWRVVQDPDAACHHPARRRFKNLASRRGLRHALAVGRHLWRHRRYRSALH